MVSAVLANCMSCSFLAFSFVCTFHLTLNSTMCVSIVSCMYMLTIFSHSFLLNLNYRKKIPHECKSQRNCQLFIVVAAVVVTIATSFQPNVDWAAHIGGVIQVSSCACHVLSCLSCCHAEFPYLSCQFTLCDSSDLLCLTVCYRSFSRAAGCAVGNRAAEQRAGCRTQPGTVLATLTCCV